MALRPSQQMPIGLLTGRHEMQSYVSFGVPSNGTNAEEITPLQLVSTWGVRWRAEISPGHEISWEEFAFRLVSMAPPISSLPNAQPSGFQTLVSRLIRSMMAGLSPAKICD